MDLSSTAVLCDIGEGSCSGNSYWARSVARNQVSLRLATEACATMFYNTLANPKVGHFL